ncbi:MAG: UvrD-helicase domain-containing protein [Bacteroidales bacterium]|nr:UvrD-helicase domain-containing protein [Bacteroidales bacterium]
MNQLNKPFKVYQASAGSGKTYTIVKEYLELCLHDEASTANYSHILAITFTNKAANEMKEKILNHLNDIINSDIQKDPDVMEADLLKDLGVDRQTLKTNASILFRKIIHDYSSFCVSTIDAFFQKLARSFAKDLNLPSQFNVSIDEDEVADAITERIGEQLGPENPFLTRILEDFCETKFEAGKKTTIANDIHAFVKTLFSESAFQKNEQNHFETEEQYNETVSYLHKVFQSFEGECNRFESQLEAFIDKHQLDTSDFKGKSKSPGLSLLKKIKDKNFVPLTKTQLDLLDGIHHWFPDGHTELEEEVQAFATPFLNYYQKNIGNYLFCKYQIPSLSLYVLRSIIKAEIESYIGEEMVVHISEFNKRINEILGDFSVPFIYERLGEHIKHLFIDEFQDTSILQWQNLIPLIDNNLANRHLNMIVGDGKQSIYRWRSGEVGQIVSLPKIFEKPADSPIFDTYEQNLIHNFQFEELKNNFRSFGNIVQFNNAFFQSSSKEFLSDESRKVYCDESNVFGKKTDIEQTIRKKDAGLVQIELFDPEEKSDEPMLRRVKELILELLEHGFQKSDIAILVRKNKHGSVAANYLHKEGIEVISPESILLRSSDRVQLIIHTLRYLIHRDNKAVIANVIYYRRVTQSPGFTGEVSHVFDPVEAIAEGKQPIEDALRLEPQLLSTLLANAYSLYDLCSALARAYGFNTLGDAFINFLLDVVYQWQSTDEHGIEAFLEYWEKKKDKLSILTSNSDAVTVMSIHKSKGLEFPVVIYPFAIDDLENSLTTTAWFTAEQLGFHPIPNIDKVQFSLSKDRIAWSPQVNLLRQQEIDNIRLDNMNLAYVAFTRPIQRLYVLTQQVKDPFKSPINAFLQKDNLPFTFQIHERQDGKEWPIVYQFGDPDLFKVEEKKETPIKSFFNESSSSTWLNKISIDPNPSMFWMNPTARFEPLEWGKFVHKILSEVSFKDDVEKAMKPYLDEGLIDTPTATMLTEVFEKMMRHPALRDAFSPQAKVKNECELLTQDYGILRPDRYAELPDKIFLLDYKTGQPTKQHKEQLLRYKHILETMVNKPIEAYLVYLEDSMKVVPVQINTEPQLSINFNMP